jgi:hypothetical protein
MFFLYPISLALLKNNNNNNNMANSRIMLTTTAGYKHYKCLKLVPYYTAVYIRNFNASQFALADKRGQCSNY